jgi:hypothetical protein
MAQREDKQRSEEKMYLQEPYVGVKIAQNTDAKDGKVLISENFKLRNMVRQTEFTVKELREKNKLQSKFISDMNKKQVYHKAKP